MGDRPAFAHPRQMAVAFTASKEEALDLHERYRVELLAAARAAAVALCRKHGTASKDEVWSALWEFAPGLMRDAQELGIDRRWTGAIFNKAMFVRVGQKPRKATGEPGTAHAGGYYQIYKLRGQDD